MGAYRSRQTKTALFGRGSILAALISQGLPSGESDE
jgi:hypothetical protein